MIVENTLTDEVTLVDFDAFSFGGASGDANDSGSNWDEISHGAALVGCMATRNPVVAGLCSLAVSASYADRSSGSSGNASSDDGRSDGNGGNS